MSEAELRHEIKFTAQPEDEGLVLAWLHTQPAAFRSAYPARYVNSLYFDAPGLEAFADSIDGESARAKLRLRWYGSLAAEGPYQLELKLRRNRVGRKRVIPIERSQLSTLPFASLVRALRHELPPEARFWLARSPQPTLITRYLRRYYASFDDRIRITLDSKLLGFDQRVHTRPNLTSPARVPRVLVLEAKFALADRAAARRALAGIPLRAARSSKYAIGLSQGLHSA